jgi:hypothetical protein
VIALDRTARWPVSRRPADFGRRLRCRRDRRVVIGGLSQLRGHRDRVPASSVGGILSFLARRVKSGTSMPGGLAGLERGHYLVKDRLLAGGNAHRAVGLR